MPDRVQLAVYLDKKEDERLGEVAEKMHYSKSQLVRMMIMCFLDKEDPVKEIVRKCIVKK
jgi:DnaJ-domain-containing protein 1